MKLNKIAIFGLLTAVSIPALAQQKDLTSGIIEFKNRKNQVKALEYFNKVEDKLNNGGSLSDKNLDKYHFYTGLVKLNVSTKDTTDIDNLTSAYSHLSKSIELDGSLKKKSTYNIVKVANTAQNRAFSFYDAKDYTNSLKCFDLLFDVQKKYLEPKTDKQKDIQSNNILYAAVAAKNNKDNNKALEYIEILLEKNPSDSRYHDQKLVLTKGTEGYFENLKTAREKCPDYQPFIIEEVNYYLSNKEHDKLIESLNIAVQKDTTNADLYFALGKTHQDLGNVAESKAAYLKAVAINPEYVDAYLNMGNIYLEKANELSEKMNNLGISSSDQKKYSKYEAEQMELFKEAMPHLENAFNIKKKESSSQLTNALKKIYRELSLGDKFQDLTNQLK